MSALPAAAQLAASHADEHEQPVLRDSALNTHDRLMLQLAALIACQAQREGFQNDASHM